MTVSNRHYKEDTKKSAITAFNAACLLISGVDMMGSQGIEPWTHGLRVRCSAS
ncbi:hypothetical protein FC82_GL001986 [Secundilactobacillus collinoides DSM 20515 = JCM 1123]|uniref:Uncharacterized protein n=1 Tax=Secundilactobacillus collinoides DSM 20515 = JCM 1123 TaxID=1423733 RepID=A0A0R2BJJ1_SECCO|nr:hypothetical protein FC82_GL001986 [Secundilactobacillus collinoides DSM 20515 = JCM 1123]